MKKIANKSSIQKISEIPDDIKAIFKTSYDVSPYWHVKMQGAFQEFTDNAVSKTVNFPNWASTKEVSDVFSLANKLNCKGITIYRDRSKDVQVLNINIENPEQKESITIMKMDELKESCPECSKVLVFSDDCATCKHCGYSICSLG